MNMSITEADPWETNSN